MSTTPRLDDHTKELLFQTLELLRKEVQPKFSDWRDADNWLFSELDYTKDELAQIYAGHDIAVSFDSAKESSEQAPAIQPKMHILCEEYEDDDAIRSFTVLAVSEDEQLLQQMLAAKVEKDEYGFIAKNGGEFEGNNQYHTEYNDGFVEYYILEEDVLSKEQIHALLQTDDYKKIHVYPDNFRDILTNTIEVYADRRQYGHIDAGKVADVLLNDDKFYATCVLDAWWSNRRALLPNDIKFVASDATYYLSDILERNPRFFIDCGAVPDVKYPDGMQALLVDCIYDLAKETRKPSIAATAEEDARVFLLNADFAKAMVNGIAFLKEQGKPCNAEAFRMYCQEFVRHQLAPEKPALDEQIGNAQSRTSKSSADKSGPDIDR